MLRDIWTVFWRDWIVLRRRLIKYVLSRMVSPFMFLIAFGWGLGRSIDIGTGSYLDFLVPGLLAMNSMNISFNSIISVHDHAALSPRAHAELHDLCGDRLSCGDVYGLL